MIGTKKVIAIIPARGGSKGVPRKNICQVGKKPLIAYSIEAARASTYVDLVVVSSDDDETLEIARNCGVTPLVRPPELARDETPSIDPVLHALDTYNEFDVVILLQPTSPLRSTRDIDNALETLGKEKACACVSVCEAASSPYRAFQLLPNKQLKRFVDTDVPTRRQDVPPFYAVNGAIYIADIQWLKNNRLFITAQTIGYVMPQIRSLDIDTELDLNFFEFLLQKYGLETISKAICPINS